MGFSVNASVSVRRKAIEQHGGKSETFVGVLTTVVSLDCSDEAAQIGCKSGGGKPVCGESIMWNHHESKTWKSRVTACEKTFSRYVQKASFLDFTTGLSLSSLGSE